MTDADWFLDQWECILKCGHLEEFTPPGFWPWIRDYVYKDDWEAVGVTVI